MALYDIIGDLGDAQTFTTLTTTEGRASTDIINLGNSDLNWGNGELWLNIKVSTLFAAKDKISSAFKICFLKISSALKICMPIISFNCKS